MRESTFLLKYYESVVNWDAKLLREGGFLTEALRSGNVHRVLDCGCGVGRHVLFLLEQGFDAHGCDYNEYHVNRARELAGERNIEADFFQADMRELPGIGDGEYDGVMTLGNTLSSFDEDDILRTFHRFSRIVRPGGMIFGQVLNYESFGREDRTETRWSTEGGREKVFLKTFHFEEDYVLMVVNLLERVEGGWETHMNTTVMHYLEREYLLSALEEAGFTDIRFFGSLTGGEFDVSRSRDLVFVGRKRFGSQKSEV